MATAQTPKIDKKAFSKMDNADLRAMNEVQLMAFMKQNNQFLQQAQANINAANQELNRRVEDWEKGGGIFPELPVPKAK